MSTALQRELSWTYSSLWSIVNLCPVGVVVGRGHKRYSFVKIAKAFFCRNPNTAYLGEGLDAS